MSSPPDIAPSTESQIEKGKLFGSREQCKTFVQDLALAQGRRAIVNKKKSGGNYIVFSCSSPTPCTFEVRVHKSKRADVHGFIVTSFCLQHHGCTGYTRPTGRQVKELATARSAVLANPKSSAKALVDQVKRADGLSVPKRMMFRVRDKIIDEEIGNYETDFTKIESLLAEFCKLNSSSYYQLERDAEGRFNRAFLSHPYVSRHNTHGQAVLGIDGTFMKHGKYKEVMLVLVGRTGNNSNFLLALTVCDAEDERNCSWFLNCARKAGVNFQGMPIFADRGKGLFAGLSHAASDSVALVYKIQAAETKEAYDSAVFILGITHPRIAEYVTKIPAERWTMHTENARHMKMYGWRTTNFVESVNGAAIDARFKFPLQLFEHYMEKFTDDAYAAQELGEQWICDRRIIIR